MAKLEVTRVDGNGRLSLHCNSIIGGLINATLINLDLPRLRRIVVLRAIVPDLNTMLVGFSDFNFIFCYFTCLNMQSYYTTKTKSMGVGVYLDTYFDSFGLCFYIIDQLIACIVRDSEVVGFLLFGSFDSVATRLIETFGWLDVVTPIHGRVAGFIVTQHKLRFGAPVALVNPL